MAPLVALLLLLMGAAAAQSPAPAAPAEKAPSEKVLFCGGIANGVPSPRCTTPPRLTYSPGPNYPKNPGKTHLPGTVQLKLVVGPDGVPRDVTVFSSLAPDFDDEAIDSVKKWKFRPATLDGRAAATEIHVEVTFKEPPPGF